MGHIEKVTVTACPGLPPITNKSPGMMSSNKLTFLVSFSTDKVPA